MTSFALLKCSVTYSCKMVYWQNILSQEQFTFCLFFHCISESIFERMLFCGPKNALNILWQNALLTKNSFFKEHIKREQFSRKYRRGFLREQKSIITKYIKKLSVLKNIFFYEAKPRFWFLSCCCQFPFYIGACLYWTTLLHQYIHLFTPS